jgi:hypothetical protein
MNNRPPLEAPSELEFLECLGIEPTDATPEDGFWRYRVNDEAGFELTLSFNTHEGSVQILLHHSGVNVFRWSHEGAERLQCHSDGKIVISCRSRDTLTTVEMCTRPRVSVRVSLLVDRH